MTTSTVAALTKKQGGQLSPEQFVHEIRTAASVNTAEETHRLLEHAKAWATVFYEAEVPDTLTAEIQALEVACRH